MAHIVVVGADGCQPSGLLPLEHHIGAFHTWLQSKLDAHTGGESR